MENLALSRCMRVVYYFSRPQTTDSTMKSEHERKDINNVEKYMHCLSLTHYDFFRHFRTFAIFLV